MSGDAVRRAEHAAAPVTSVSAAASPGTTQPLGVATITIGEPGQHTSVFPFGGSLRSGTRYQQAYSADNFNGLGPILISSIGFIDGNGGLFGTSSYRFGLSTISADIDALSTTNFDANRGN